MGAGVGLGEGAVVGVTTGAAAEGAGVDVGTADGEGAGLGNGAGVMTGDGAWVTVGEGPVDGVSPADGEGVCVWVSIGDLSNSMLDGSGISTLIAQLLSIKINTMRTINILCFISDPLFIFYC
jgi:hypothetical protein